MATHKAKVFVSDAIKKARDAFGRGDSHLAWNLLAEAHIVSQPHAWLHTVVHFQMFCLGIREGSPREIVGQAARLFLASPGSWSKRFPIGNTGRSNVSMFAPMEIPPSLKSWLEDSE